MTSDRPPIGDTTLTASGIAQLANVGRAAVSNWRRRYADFPAPVGGTPTSPVFDARAVEQWLSAQGKLSEASTEQWVWRHLESYSPATKIGDTLCIVGAFLLVAQGTPANRGSVPTPRQLLARVRTRDDSLAQLLEPLIPQEWPAQLEVILRAVHQLSGEQDPATAFEFLHMQYVTSPSSMSGLAATPDVICQIMLTVVSPASDLLDFTTGTGSILHAAAQQALRDGRAIQCHGQEIKPQYAIITLLRLLLIDTRARQAGIAAKAPVVRIGDSLLNDQFADLRAPAVAANFPFGIHDWGHERLTLDSRWAYGMPPRTEPELAWVQHALAHLTPGGTAAVLMPPACAARPAGRRIRAELVRRGALQAVIALPAGLMPPTGIGLHIWVLTRPVDHQQPGHRLLMVDCTALPRGTALPLIVEQAWHTYQTADDATNRPGVFRVVPAIEVLDERVDLTPRRHLPQQDDPAGNPEQTMVGIRTFGDLLDAVRTQLPALRPADPRQTAPSQVSLADLIRTGSLGIHRSIARSQPDTSQIPVLTAADVLTERPPTGLLGQVDEHALVRVQAGDVLVPVHSREIVATVATPEQVGAALDPSVQAVRVNPDLLDPWFVAGMVAKRDNARLAGRTSTSSTGTIRVDLRRLTLPVLPLEQQQQHGVAFKQVATFRTTLLRAAETGEALARNLSDGLASGRLAAVGSTPVRTPAAREVTEIPAIDL